jgi:predicted small integral membrane protein
MTKLTLLAVLGLIYLGVLRLAYFFMAVFIILFFGMSVWELIRTARQPAKHPFAAQ